MNNYLYILLLSMILFIKCSSDQSTHMEMTTLPVFKNTVEQIKAEDLITDIQYIPLETNSNCLIGHIDKIAISDDRLYILDKDSSKKLFVFDLDGNFIGSIGEPGKGPQEYIKLIDFSIDEKTKEIVLLDNFRKILIFKFSGEFVKSKKLSEKNFFQNICCHDGAYYLSTDNLVGNSDKFSIFKFDNNLTGEKILKFENYCNFIHPVDNPVFHYNGTLYYLDIFNSFLYESNKNQWREKYAFDFEGQYMPLDYTNNSNLFFENYGKYCFLQRCIAGNDHIFLQILNKAKYNVGIINMKNNNMTLYQSISCDSIAFRPPYCYYKSKFYSAIEPGVVLDNAKSFRQLLDNYLITPNNNPIIFTYNFKFND